MSSQVIPCPACQHDVRVPESLFGQPVRCPQCKAYFNAPTRDAEGNVGKAELVDESLVPPPRPIVPRTPLSSSPCAMAGTLLMIVGIMGSLVNGYQAIDSLKNPEQVKQRVTDGLKMYSQMTKQEFTEEQTEQIAKGLPVVSSIFFGISVVPVLGALAMLRMRMWWLAVMGSLVAIFNIGNCCCMIGLPAGIYSLLKLFDPEIRALFRR